MLPGGRVTSVRRERSAREQADLARIGRERLEASRAVERTQRRELARVCAEMLCSAVGGMGLVGWAMHVGDVETGRILLSAGVLVIVAGVVLPATFAWKRAERRGDL